MTLKQTIHKHQRAFEMLKEFGLSQNDALIYMYLLERGSETGGSKIALGTGIHRQYVYIGLERLIGMGLVEVVRGGTHNKYRAVGESQIEKIARRRVVEAESIVRELGTFSLVGHEQDFSVHQGERQCQDFEIDFAKNLSRNDEQWVIGGATDRFYEMMGDTYEEFVEIIKAKNLTTYYIGPKEELAAMQKAKKAHPGFIYRSLDGFPKGILNVVVRKDSVATYTFAHPPLVYVIKSTIVAENYKRYFEMLWNMSSPPDGQEMATATP
jgi:sugar-specific transcriptional regulator TrmB